MDGQPPTVEVIRLVAEQIEKLTIHEGGHEIESAVRIRKDHKQRRLLVAQGIQFQFVIFHQVPQLLDIEGSKPGTAGNQYTFECLAGNGDVCSLAMLTAADACAAESVAGGSDLAAGDGDVIAVAAVAAADSCAPIAALGLDLAAGDGDVTAGAMPAAYACAV